MTNPNSTMLAVLVDRSGSMGTIKEDMEGAINTFIESQKGQDGTCLVTLADFNYTMTYKAKSIPVEEMEPYTLIPSGGTALNDSMGKFITDVGRGLKALPENQRPGKVIVLIITDGYENSSKNFSTEAIKEMVTAQQDTWSWEFVFLGKDIDSFAQAGAWGIRRESTLDFRNAPVAMASAGEYVTNSRSGMVYADNVAQTINDSALRAAAMKKEESK